ncbi:hypothetical protein EIZ62_01200 [Streptomyces ficellus]|uniref:Uncharacterized protein n=1 Tax=Streptomyces ficellus TaxID=1977088 RepID=A0A6I6F9Y7_9ACTN|nr:hypothetical protein EIZ62_01200 [Streptomyces ficellus]
MSRRFGLPDTRGRGSARRGRRAPARGGGRGRVPGGGGVPADGGAGPLGRRRFLAGSLPPGGEVPVFATPRRTAKSGTAGR